MSVYNSKMQNVREVTIRPSNTWSGHSQGQGQGLLGISIRFCSFKNATENVWHILEVEPGSPAALAGLKPYSDYVIGADSILQESEDLFSLIEAHDNKPLKLFVYNVTTDTCRQVTITPNSHWGGKFRSARFLIRIYFGVLQLRIFFKTFFKTLQVLVTWAVALHTAICIVYQ